MKQKGNSYIKQITKRLIQTLTIMVLFSCSMAIAEEQPPLRVVFAEGLEPLCWEENGKPMGEQPEIAQYVINKLGIKAEYIFLPWARAQMMVETGKADLMMTTPNKTRFEIAVFGKEMTTPNYWNIFVDKKKGLIIEAAKKFEKLEDLKPYSILDFLGNGWTGAFLKESDGYKIDKAPKMEQVVMKLAHGRADLTINSSTSVNWFLAKLNLAHEVEEIDIVAPGTRFHMVFQVGRKSPWVEKGLVRALDEELKKMKDSGEWLKILQKYKDPYATGRPFKSLLVTDEFYKDYDSYPIYKPGV
ncbi:MAG: transporter substrate-binding domain-containing protein [Desulfamplus sp.]|nr:transporter substrate-binding domain-containing protein [Desulfamplus sp.]